MSGDQEARTAGQAARQSEQPILRATIEVHPDRIDTRLSFGLGVKHEDGAKAVEQALASLHAEFDGRHGCPANPVGRATCGYVECAALGKSSCEDCRETPLRAGQGTVEPCAWAGGNDTCYCRTCGEEYRYGREDKPACPKKPAPVSPRTGDEGTVTVPLEPTEEMCLAGLGVDRTSVFSAPSVMRNMAASYRAMIAARPASPEAQGAWRSRAAEDVLAERRRQIEAEGWTPEHDDAHSRCEMAAAAACYATAPSPIRIEREWTYPDAPANWPWCRSWWKPRFYRRNLVKAAALLIAEIERWDRLSAPPSSDRGGE